VVDYQYNPQQAKQLLIKAGYCQMALTFSFGICRLADPTNPKPIAEAFAAELSAIGIKNMQTKDWAAYLEDRAPNWLSSLHDGLDR